MRVNWKIFGMLLVIVVLAGLYGFSNQRNSIRNLTDISVQFTDENPPFISRNAVNKLLIQNEDSLSGMHKDELVLRVMEQRLQAHPMVQNAQVFLTVDGQVGARIEQRKPLARVVGSPSFYLDDQGEKMPLSEVYSARVPLVSGIQPDQYQVILPFLRELDQDEFLKQMVVGVQIDSNDELALHLRKHDLVVQFGKPTSLAQKIRNFKAFYQKTRKDNTLVNYESVDLKFGNQVVATKK
ncbi:cell division protein FtsQ/DivIB [Aureitalea marina]|uniref:Cell division protein FtsQ n=1 Tax=Aureitalea marina TaxID=930804 RepID=A0A2S7KM26_9FLAO|nr:cell division protein FtsQ/DivIB [Aureitalea marina]PQB03685.1 hypothetical protein BST85_01290 [Aureitalea marina]